MAKYTKTKSKYVLKTPHALTKEGGVFEQDLSTYNDIYGYDNGNLIIGNGNGFNLITNTTDTVSKNYDNGSVVNSFTLSDFISDLKTESKINPLIKTNTVNSSVKINKNYFDLTKISYYGSCTSHIKAAIEGIILNYPASLFVTNTNNLNTNTLTIPLSAISNPFSIDIANYTTYDRNDMEFDLKVMATSYSGYTISDSSGATYSEISGFTNDGTNLIFYLTNTINLSGNFHIKPNDNYEKYFYDSLVGIQLMLLNKNSVPKFKSKFKTIEETEDGVSYKYVEFIWKTYDGYNLDITSIDYLNFVDNLIESSEYIDQKFSDNIYRMLTHDSVKSMDNSYIKENRVYIDGDDVEDIIDGETKIQKLMRIYGRYYDDIKEYVDGVSFVNNISYDKKENLNNIYLQDKLNYFGWNVPKLTNIFNTTTKTNSNLYKGINGNYTLTDVENDINRRFIINSKNIFKSKGTVKSIRKIFGMFGVDERVFDIREYSQDVENYITGETLEKIKELNGVLRTNVIDDPFINGIDGNDSSLYGLNIKTFVKCPICGELDYVTNFNITNENLINDSKGVFEGDSGEYSFKTWSNVVNGVSGKTFTISCDARVYSNGVNTQVLLVAYENTWGFLNSSIFSTTNNNEWETISRTFTVPNNYNGQINLGIYNYPNNNGGGVEVRNVKFETGETLTMWSPSFSDREVIDYGICVKNQHSFDITGNTFGYPQARANNSGYYFQQMGSWYRETGGVHNDVSGNTYVTDIYSGNNPHIGDGGYDYGTNYIDNFKELFKSDIDSQLNYPTIDVTGYTGYGFILPNKKTIDNKKISVNILGILTDDYGEPILTDNDEIIYAYYDGLNSALRINLKNFVIGIDTTKALELFTSGNTSYTGGLTEDNIFETIKKLVLPYIENVIPSTTIFDFVKIDKTTPKWQLVEKYPERTGSTQNYSGKTILRYKNVNYYDETTIGVTQDLLDLIEKDFGDMFTQYGSVIGSGFDMEVSFIGDNDEYERVTIADWQETDNLFNFLTT